MKVCRDTMVHVHRSKDNLWELALSFRGVGTGTNTVPQAWKQAPLPSQLSQPLMIALDSQWLLSCQLDRLWNHLGGTPQGIPMRTLPRRTNLERKIPSLCEETFPGGPNRKGSRGKESNAAFTCSRASSSMASSPPVLPAILRWH